MNNLIMSYELSDIVYKTLPNIFSGFLGKLLFIIISLAIVTLVGYVSKRKSTTAFTAIGVLIVDILFLTQKTVGKIFDQIVNWMKDNLDSIFDPIKFLIELSVDIFELFMTVHPPLWLALLLLLSSTVIAYLLRGKKETLYTFIGMLGIYLIGYFDQPLSMLVLFTVLAYFLSGRKVAIFTFIGLLAINFMGYWDQMILTLSMVMVSTVIAVVIGIPVGILTARNEQFNKFIRPVLDLMQTMPAYVYLIPAVLFFQLGTVPGVIATIVFSMPPSVRLTNLGIRQVPGDVVEAAESFGTTSTQLLLRVQLPLAKPTILAGLNQTIMLALSMVVISAMIGAKGLGLEVYNSITQLKIGQGFESGISIVILAMVLDRITHALGSNEK